MMRLVARELGAARSSRERELRLNEHLLHRFVLGLELVVDLVQVLQSDAVGDHLHGVQLAGLDHLEQVLPVLLYRSLAIANEAHATLHQ